MSYTRILWSVEKLGEGGRKEEKKEKEKEELMSLLLQGGGWGVEGVRKKRRRRWKGRGGSLTSARLEPQWLARIQPHSAFDEGWILKLNQSHMSPTERERETERPERLGDVDRGGAGDEEGTEGGLEDRK